MHNEGNESYNWIDRLSPEDAQHLAEAYWNQRDRFLSELHDRAESLDVSLPSPDVGYLPADLDPLQRFLEYVLLKLQKPLQFPEVPRWLRDIHDPIDLNVRLSNDEIWLGLCVSYAFADSLLRTVKGARLGIADPTIKRYIHRNCPVIKGQWHGDGSIEDAPILAIGCTTIRIIKDPSWEARSLRETYDVEVEYARIRGCVQEEGW